jgi:hypothetical protein
VRYAVPRLFAALFLAGVGIVPVAGPPAAATGSSDSGVSVVVDFSKVGGGVVTTCVEGGGGDSAAQLLEVDHALTRDQAYPGVVCKIDGAPADAECRNMPPANAYWGLFWSDGHGGWKYSSQGVDSLDVPAGGSVGMAWQDGGTNDVPGAAPPQHSSSQPSSSPSSQPSSSPSSKPAGGGAGSGGGASSGGGTGSGSDSATGASTPSPTGAETGRHDRKHASEQGSAHRKRHTGTHSSTPSPSAGTSSAQPLAEEPAATPDVPPTDDSGGMPGWVPLAAIGLLFATAVGAGVVQRRRS